MMTKPKAAEMEGQGDGALDPKALEAIGRALRAHYDDLVQAPLPQKFIDLLTQLEAEEQLCEPQGRRDAAK
jgi:hypothetical protein